MKRVHAKKASRKEKCVKSEISNHLYMFTREYQKEKERITRGTTQITNQNIKILFHVFVFSYNARKIGR